MSERPEKSRTSGGERRREQRRSSRDSKGRREGESRSAEGRRRQFGKAERIRRRTALQKFVDRHDLEMFGQVLAQMAHTVFGPRASVVAHLRRHEDQEYLAYVVDAADPTAAVRYDAFLPRERTFWSLFSAMPKPQAPIAVAVRPARGWCRVEALAPVFKEKEAR
jgi:hypothetical protein